MTVTCSTGLLRMPASVVTVLAAFLLATLVLLPATTDAAGSKGLTRGSLVQKAGKSGCVVDRSTPKQGCAIARAIEGPGPFMGSHAIALSPNGAHVYVASSGSNAIAVFSRNRKTGNLTQAKGKAGCVSLKGSFGCARAVGLKGPNSIALSPDGGYLYATSRDSSSVTAFRRNRTTGRLTQLASGSGCVSSLPLPGCASGRALAGADVVAVSPDGTNVYVGAFLGNAVAVFDRDPSTGALTQPADETGCITEAPTSGCSQGIALSSPEGLAVNGDGTNVYVASATSNAVLTFNRDTTTGALTQADDGTGCIAQSPLTGCSTGFELSGANAVALSPDDQDVYVTSLISSSLTSFKRGAAGALGQIPGAGGCVAWLKQPPCTPGRALRAPEGLAVSPDGRNIYVTAFSSGGIAVMNRFRPTGTVVQKPGRDGCVTVQSIANCNVGRALAGVSSIALSPDGRFAYATANKSNAIAVFRRVTGN